MGKTGYIMLVGKGERDRDKEGDREIEEDIDRWRDIEKEIDRR